MKIFAGRHPARGLCLLNESGSGRTLFGDDFDRKLQEMVGALSQYQKRLDRAVSDYPDMSLWLNEELEQWIDRKTLLFFVLLLQQVDQALPDRIAEQWLLSRKLQKTIAAMVSIETSDLRELSSVACNPRALYWWSQRIGVEPKLLLLYAACKSQPGESIAEEMAPWISFADQIADKRFSDLVYGRWLVSCLGIEEGPEMSRALELLRNAEISGQVANEEEARDFLSRTYLDKD